MCELQEQIKLLAEKMVEELNWGFEWVLDEVNKYTLDEDINTQWDDGNIRKKLSPLDVKKLNAVIIKELIRIIKDECYSNLDLFNELTHKDIEELKNGMEIWETEQPDLWYKYGKAIGFTW